MKIETTPQLDFHNVLIRPKRTTISSRSEVDLEREIVWDFTYESNISSHWIARAQKYPIDYLETSILFGDVNSDGIINILDVVSTVNIVLGLAPWVDAADYNDDGVINVLDIVSIVNIILAN